MKLCISCKAEIDDQAKVCPRCGARQGKAEAPEGAPSRDPQAADGEAKRVQPIPESHWPKITPMKKEAAPEVEEPQGKEEASSLFEHVGRKRALIALAILGALLVVILVGRFFLDKPKEEEPEPVEVAIEEQPQTEEALLSGADEDIVQMMYDYYQAFDQNDVEAARQLLDELEPADEPAILDVSYDHYTIDQVYIREGLTKNARLVLVTYTYQCAGIDTPVPAYSCLYVQLDSEGNWKISSHAATDEGIRSYMETLRQDKEFLEVISAVRERYEETIKANPQLLDLIGDTSFSAALVNAQDGERLRAKTNVNVRAVPDANGPLIGSLDEDEVVVKQGREGDWIIIDYEGQRAYVFGEFMEILE